MATLSAQFLLWFYAQLPSFCWAQPTYVAHLSTPKAQTDRYRDELDQKTVLSLGEFE